MKIFNQLKSEIEQNSKVISSDLSENLLTIYTNIPFKNSNELLVLHVVKSVKGHYFLSDLGYLLEVLFYQGEGVDKIESNIGITKLDFDEKNVYAQISTDNINWAIDQFAKFVRLLEV